MKRKIFLAIVGFVALYLLLAFLGIFMARLEVNNLQNLNQIPVKEVVKFQSQSLKRIKRDIWLVRPILKRLPSWQERLALLQTIDDLQPLIAALSSDDEKIILVVFQNNTELRPSGGFWGAYGILKVRGGQIVSFESADTYFADLENLGTPDPPKEVAEIIGDEWRFWNANWSPDFKQSVADGLDFYYRAHPETRFFAVLGLNLNYVKDLVRVHGPVTLNDHDFEINQDNLVEKLIYEPYEPGHETSSSQGRISNQTKNTLLGQIGLKVMTDLYNGQATPELVTATQDALTKQDLVLYFESSKLQNIIEAQRWGGRVPQDSNLVMLIDANLGSKLDFFIDKKMVVKNLGEGRYQAMITYTNTYNDEGATIKQPFKIYRDFVRLFVPYDSRLISQGGGERPGVAQKDEALHQTYFSNLIILPQGKTSVVTFTWEVPEAYRSKTLGIATQSGSHIEIVTR